MIFPAMDLMDGGCVRLLKGDFAARTNYATDPIEVANNYASAGAEWMHIVDLDGAKNGQAEQSDLILKIANSADIKVQTGGGLRDLAQIKRLLEGGVNRVVIGSLAVTNPQMVKHWLRDVGPDAICLALDVNQGEDGEFRPATKGWTEASNKTIWDVIGDYLGSGLKTILVTDIGRDGMQTGGNIDLYKRIQSEFPSLDLISSGGVGTLDHVRDLKAIDPYGIIIGKALYEGAFTLPEAIQC
ncbi:1-(5-phosphoribosyl)-5-[(5-phosphoribosylamino) methylideneamino] imidazole-4-carboxamide isomerase [Litorimonas cladophorae]|uniref:1-(5-phosphoribosyl)-5-[(5-phosphoribosylamino)methylideneamino] imidazole-4-carboxamide isomerase n=1 Tax=Litorimonas cladophorae TaxID=1220491 RepID=A0A918KF92_9PROT|nr:1-(5-phosphoribosyl)-5-[(5-phosphoribosylamino)methylideneamino]imidazole-4-carboxamide isomerase [Litorimonas cladophorae]GGX58961.1 1-(5-phosphoribosyl)-5-[(5-phosphoribosylamino) methylideneamino] imidazole-4-carboxamide isomerase [Litorimonas cladophorae]